MVDSYSQKPLAAGVTTVGTFAPDELVICAGTARVRTIASGSGVVARGTVLGKITASGKLTTSLTAASDGSQTPYVIAAETVDATSADADAVVYFSGSFNTNKLIYGTGHSLSTVFDPFRQLDIELHTGIPF